MTAPERSQREITRIKDTEGITQAFVVTEPAPAGHRGKIRIVYRPSRRFEVMEKEKTRKEADEVGN